MFNEIRVVPNFDIKSNLENLKKFLNTEKINNIDKKIKEIKNSDYNCLIFIKEELIGFLYITEKLENINFVELFVGKEHNDIGICIYAFDYLKTVSTISNFMILKINKKNNTFENMALNVGINIHETEKNCYYLMQVEKISEFFNNDRNFENFINYCDVEEKKEKIKIKIS